MPRPIAVAGSRIKTINDLAPADKLSDKPLEEIFTTNSRDKAAAARKVLAYLQQDGSPHDLLHEARRLVFLKGNDAHDYKYSSAVLEDYGHVSPEWRKHLHGLEPV